MAFDVYPAAHTAPLTVVPAATSTPDALTERFGADNYMHIRVAMSAATCGPAGSPNPTVFLRAGTGASTEVQVLPNVSVINNGTSVVANAFAQIESNGIVYVRIFRTTPTPQTWALSIRNNDAAIARDFVWAGATADAESKQPWINAAASVSDNLLVGQAGSLVPAVKVQNRGTGNLSLQDPVGMSLGTGLTLASYSSGPPPITLAPTACVDIVVSAAAPVAPGTTNATFDVTSSDALGQTAGATTHNRRVALQVNAAKLEIVLLLDASGSMNDRPDGSSTGVFEQKRWGLLVHAVEEFFALITQIGAAYGSTVGSFGVAIFSGGTTGTIDTAEKIDVTNSGKVLSVVNALKATTPSGGTPMGAGIEHVLGSVAGASNFYNMDAASLTNNRRWMVFMSDGAHNSGVDPSTFLTGSNSFDAKKVKAFTIAYGAPGAAEYDPARLAGIASSTGGISQVANTSDGQFAHNLRKAFRDALITGLSLVPILDPRAVLTSGTPEIRRGISITTYDRLLSVVVTWETFDPSHVSVQLITPNCEVITAAVAQADPHIAFTGASRSAIFTFDQSYLRNDATPSEPRGGLWTLVMSIDPGVASEQIAYDVMVDSGLKLDVDFVNDPRYAGDSLDVAAALTLDGVGIENASVAMRIASPGMASSAWLAESLVTEAEWQAAEQAIGPDRTFYSVKALALKNKGVAFPGFDVNDTITLLDDDHDGTYRASVATTVEGAYTLHVVATGTTDDGVPFRRERMLRPYLDVRPDPLFTLIEIIFGRYGGEGPLTALVVVTLKDRFGNVLLLDPALNPAINLTIAGGQFTGPLIAALNGTYVRPIQFAPTTSPVISVAVGGQVIVPAHVVPAVSNLTYADQVVAYVAGAEAAPGINTHTDPTAALGPPTSKLPDTFVSLGATGAITLGVKGQAVLSSGATDQPDFSVFVRPDRDLRSYRVEALVDGRWHELGTSPGLSQDFSLTAANLPFANAIRVTDTSGRMIDSTFAPESTPGVSVLAVGFAKVGDVPGGCGAWIQRVVAWIKGKF